MATDTTIEWADKTWSPLIGCDRVSDGCTGCYAITTAHIRTSHPNPKISTAFAGTTHRNNDRTDWTGQINQLEDRLTQPLAWKKPRKVFVNSQSDLFHKNVDHDFIAKVFAVMALTPQHTFQILTKRHARMRSVLNDTCDCGNGHVPGVHFRSAMAWAVSKANPNRIPGLPDDAEQQVYNAPWPLQNVWMGVSVEDQHWADIRITALLDTPAAVRWISAEPLLGPINLHADLRNDVYRCACGAWERDGHLHPLCPDCGKGWRYKPGDARLNWVVAGGESGPGARPAHLDWFRTLRDQCVAANVPYLFKQWGEWGPEWPVDADGAIVRGKRGLGIALANDGTVYQPGDLTYPDGPRYGEAVRAGHDKARLTAMYHLGKKVAGRELDGRTWDQYPDNP